MKTDILILGGGLSALACAYEALENSACQVTLVQCGGGASPYIHGFCLPLTEEDSPQLLYKDTMASGAELCDPELVQTLCQGSQTLRDWFASLSLDIDREDGKPRLLKALGSSVPRIAGICNATGPALMQQLRRRLAGSERYRELRHHRGVQLLGQEGRVIGARCYDLNKAEFFPVYAQVTVLATGGFCRIFPDNTNSREMGGDGIAMAYDVGAGLRDMEFVQFEPCVAVYPPQVAGKGIITTMFYNGAVLRDKNMYRFMPEYCEDAECVPKDVLSRCIAQQIQKVGATEHGGIYFDATGVTPQLWETVYQPYLQRYLNCGIDLRTTPVEIAPAAHTSCGGVVIDSSCRTGIEGLIACGEVTGGLHGANRLGGNAGLETMVFGRIAGKTAAAAAMTSIPLPQQDDPVPDTPAKADIAAMRQELELALRAGLGVVRRKESMEQARETFARLLTQLDGWENSFEMLRLRNDALTALLTADAALARTRSVGCHCRQDA